MSQVSVVAHRTQCRHRYFSTQVTLARTTVKNAISGHWELYYTKCYIRNTRLITRVSEWRECKERTFRENLGIWIILSMEHLLKIHIKGYVGLN